MLIKFPSLLTQRVLSGHVISRLCFFVILIEEKALKKV